MSDTPLKVLIIEDDSEDAMLAKDILREAPGLHGPHVSVVSTAEEAIEVLCRNEHDVCLLDYMLGARSGVEVLREARARDCKTPVIMLTAHDDRVIDLEAMEAGACDFLPKGKANIDMIERSIRYAVRQREIQTALVDELTSSALYDALTGLPNRRLLMDRLDQEMKQFQRDENHRFGLLFLDFDGFKAVNDEYGHLVGDALLRAISNRLTHELRLTDTVSYIAGPTVPARFGGDEFVVLLQEINDPKILVSTAERLRAAAARTYDVHQQLLRVDVSIGAVIVNASFKSPQDVIQRADEAMYAAKRGGGGRVKLAEAHRGDAIEEEA